MFTFIIAVSLLILTPGPGVLSAAGVGAAYGRAAGFNYIFGLFIGNNLVALSVISGLAAIVLAAPVVRSILLFASFFYLVFLATRIMFANNGVAFIKSRSRPSWRTGITLQLINPKAYAVNTTLFGGFELAGFAPQTELILKLVIFNLIWIPIHFLWVYAGIRVRELNLANDVQRMVNFAMGISLILVVALAALSML
ncbi:MAG: threonine/homoserine/homoserine lactone efflux protein [Parasphingorhabdus sp.]|jgi:threonine/homoserine/homoserine lactone efflux protein